MRVVRRWRFVRLAATAEGKIPYLLADSEGNTLIYLGDDRDNLSFSARITDEVLEELLHHYRREAAEREFYEAVEDYLLR